MIELSEVKLEKLIIHNVGNKKMEEGVQHSGDEMVIENDTLRDSLLKFFLTPFKSEVFYYFIDIDTENQNVIYHLVDDIFHDQDRFYEHSLKIADHLYDCSYHPKIKGGELYIAFFEDFVVEGELVNGIGIFKSENKDTYLKVYQAGALYQVDCENGININRLDKGCLIFNTEKDKGYKISILDNINKITEAQYWKEEFLHISERRDDFYHTNKYIDICHDFSQHILTEDNGVDKQKQIDFLKKSESFFTENEEFENKEFLNEVVQEPGLIEAFNDYKEVYEEHNNIQTEDHFNIASNAVKKAKKNFKSVIKLDKNFHLYVHGKPEFLEKGYDQDKKMNFYKVYFDNEH